MVLIVLLVLLLVVVGGTAIAVSPLLWIAALAVAVCIVVGFARRHP